MNLKELKEMINLMNENGLHELEIEKDNVKIKLKKQSGGGIVREMVEVPSAVPLRAVMQGSPAGGAAVSHASETSADEILVRSPMVGTFYSAASPEAPPYVTEGKPVKVDEVLCIIEAMKLMNEIKCETGGIVTAILVKNGQAVEYDQPLFKIKKSS